MKGHGKSFHSQGSGPNGCGSGGQGHRTAARTHCRVGGETGPGKKELLELLQTALQRYGQAAQAVGQGRKKTKTRRPTGTSTTFAADFPARSRQPYRTVHAGLLCGYLAKL